MARDYTALPFEYLEEMDYLSDAEYGRLIRALQQYSITGEEPAKLSGQEKGHWKRVRNRENRYRESFDAADKAKSERGAKAANARWSKAKNANGCTSMHEDACDAKTNTEAETKANTETDVSSAIAEGDHAPAPARDDDMERVMRFYMENISKAIPSSVTTQAIMGFVADLGADVVLHALEITAEAEAHDWRYTKRILERYRDSGLKTIEAVRENEALAKQSKLGWRKTGKAAPPAPAGPRDETKTMDQVKRLRQKILEGACREEITDA